MKRKVPWQKQFIDSLVNTYLTVDSSTWFPFSGDALVPYYYSSYCQKIIKAIRKLKDKKIPAAQAAFYIRRPSVLLSELDLLVSYLGTRSTKMSSGDAALIFDFFSQMLISYNPFDPFRLGGKNFVLEQGEINKIMTKTKWEKASFVSAKSLGKLVASLHTLYCSLYTDLWPASGVEFHGPYEVKFESKKCILIVRDYYDIAPKQIWPRFVNFNPKSVRILNIYRPSKFFIDFYGNITCGGNLIELLVAFSVIADNKVVSMENMLSLTAQLGGRSIEQYEYFRKLPFEQIKRKYLESHVYGLKGLFDLAGLSWKPNRQMYQDIAGKALLPRIKAWDDVKSSVKVLNKGLSIVYPSRLS